MGIFDFLKKNKNIENDNGLNETYYFNGKGGLRESFHKKDGVLHGKYIELEMYKRGFSYVKSDRNGVVKQIGEYKNGKKEGVWFYNGQDGLTDYNLTGSKRWVVTYKNGILHGKFEVYLTLPEDIKLVGRTPVTKRNLHYHFLDGGESFTIEDTNIERLVEEGECVDGVKNGEWKIYEWEMENPEAPLSDPEADYIHDGYLLKKNKPTLNIKETYTTIWEKGNIKVESTTESKNKPRIFKGYKNSLGELECQHPCQDSKIPLIYINSIKDNNDTNIIDCFGNNVKYDSEWALRWSFIDREIQ